MKIFLVVFLFLSVLSFAKENIYVGVGGTSRLDKSVWWGDDTGYGFSLYGEWRSLRLEIKNSYFGEREIGLKWNLEFSLMFPTYVLRPLLNEFENIDVIKIISHGFYLSPVFTFEYDNYLDGVFSYEVAFGYRFEFSKIKFGNWFLEMQGSFRPWNSLVYPLYTYRIQLFAGYMF